MSAKLSDLHGQVIEYLQQGKFAEGIEDFYAENASAQENTNEPTVSSDFMGISIRVLELNDDTDILRMGRNQHKTIL